MANKTLSDLRLSVRSLYGDVDSVTANDTEVDLHLEDGVNRVLERCPWIKVETFLNEGNLTTDEFGGFNLATLLADDIAQIYSVEIKTQGAADTEFNRLSAIQAGLLAETTMVTANSLKQVMGYWFDGARITFYPYIRSTALTVRVLYASNKIGSLFPTLAGSTLPAYFPGQGEEAAIRYAVAQLHLRDNNLEGYQLLMTDFEGRVLDVIATRNRWERGRPFKVYQTDYYVLDGESYYAG